MKPETPTLVAAVVGVGVTLFISLVPFVQFAYREPGLHLLLDVAAAMVGFLVAFLLFGRFRQRAEFADLVLIYAMLLFALANLGLSAFPRVISGQVPEGVAAWSQAFLRVVAAIAFAAAPFLRRRPVTSKRATLGLWAAVVVTIAIIMLVIDSLGTLPPTLDPRLSPESSLRPRVVGQPFVLGAQLTSALAFAVGVFGYLRAARRGGDELWVWCAAGGTLAAFSRVNFFLFPSLYSEWFYTGDVLRFGFYSLLLVGAAREIRSYWVRDERRRIARDLHDGLAQELAFVVAQSQEMRHRDPRPDELDMLSAAAQRALDESRRAITLLSTRRPEPAERVLEQTAQIMTARHNVRLTLDVSPIGVVSADVLETLIRVLREALTNVGRHAGATTATVTARRAGDGLELRVHDNGIGFDLSAPRQLALTGGFGLLSMEERVRALGGEFSVTSQPGRGTEVRAWIPHSARAR